MNFLKVIFTGPDNFETDCINADADNNVDIREETSQNATYVTRVELYDVFHDIQDEEGRGRKRKTLEAEDMKIISMIKKLRIRSSAKIS